MLEVGDTFQQGGFTYKVIDKDAQGRPISTLCKEETPVEEKKKEEEVPVDKVKEKTPVEGQETKAGEMKQESLVENAEPAKKRGRK